MSARRNFIEDVESIYTLKGSKAFQGFEINRTLFEGKSEYQDIAIYENDTLGRVLAIDGVIQITECDEFVYQEMMTHVPLCSHEKPENVLIIGNSIKVNEKLSKFVDPLSSNFKIIQSNNDSELISSIFAFSPETDLNENMINKKSIYLFIKI